MTSDKQQRKDTPIASGVLDYFPDAIAEVAHVSKVGNDQHNPGQPMHWDRSKSSDEADCIARHLLERGTIDTDGLRHSAKVAWRALALLQKEIEAARPPLQKLKDRACVPGPKPENPRKLRVYIAGPMRGLPELNFPAFDNAATIGRARGFEVISPAEEDRKRGLDPATYKDSPDKTREFVKRDLDFILSVDAVAVLPGWGHSLGARAEVRVAKWLGLIILNAEDFRPLEERFLE